MLISNWIRYRVGSIWISIVVELIVVELVAGMLLMTVDRDAQAGLFQITNRSYGSATASEITAIDAVFNNLQNQVNASLPNADYTTYLTNISNSNAISGAGLGTDYTNTFNVAEVGFGVGLGAELGGQNITNFISGSVKANEIAGFGGQYSIMLGLKPAFFTKKTKFGAFDPQRFRVFLHYLSSDLHRSRVAISFTSWGLSGQYDIVAGSSPGVLFARWEGVSLTTGVRYSSMNATIAETVNQTSTGTLTGVGTMTTNFAGTIKLGANSSITSIPIEFSTAGRFFGVLPLFGGLASDVDLGSSTAIASLTGPITASESSGTLGTISGTGSLNLGSSGGPSTFDFRYFLGTGLYFKLGSLLVQYNDSLVTSAIGVTAALRILW